MEARNNINTKSIVSLVTGILSLLIPFVGIILGIIGIIFSRRGIAEIITTNEEGRGLALAGGIRSIVGVTVQASFLLLFLLYFGTTNSY